MKGIYKFTNNITKKSYIGQSINLESRYNSHKRNYLNKNLSTYNSKFYRAIRKYGFENFTYEILSFSELKKIVYGVHFQNLPIYKKRKRKWYLNGTCIDYPYNEE